MLIVTDPLHLAYREFPWIQSWQEQMACGRLRGLFHSANLPNPLPPTFFFLFCLFLARTTQPFFVSFYFFVFPPFCFYWFWSFSLFALALFAQEHTSSVLALLISLYSLSLFFIVLALFLYLGSPYKSHSRSVSDHSGNGHVCCCRYYVETVVYHICYICCCLTCQELNH